MTCLSAAAEWCLSQEAEGIPTVAVAGARWINVPAPDTQKN